MVRSGSDRGRVATRVLAGWTAMALAWAIPACGNGNGDGNTANPDGAIATEDGPIVDPPDAADPDTALSDTLATTDSGAPGPTPGTCAVVQRRTASVGGPTHSPAIVWSNESYQVAWNDGRSGNADVFTAWLNRDGTRRAGTTDTMVAHTGSVTTAVRLSPLSNGRSFIVWENCSPTLPDCADGTSVSALMVDQSGVPMGPVASLTGVANVQRRPYVISALDGVYVTFRDLEGPTTVGRVLHFADSGALTTDSITLGGESAGFYPFIASGNGELVAVFSRGLTAGEIVLTRMNAALAPLASLVVRTGTTSATNPTAVWNGSGWLVAWEDTSSDSVHALTALVPADASSVSASRLLQAAEGDWPQMASQGGDTGVAFYGFPNNAQIMFARLNSAGQGIGPVIQVSDDAGRARYPAIASSDRAGDFGIVWSDERSGELLFAQVECR